LRPLLLEVRDSQVILREARFRTDGERAVQCLLRFAELTAIRVCLPEAGPGAGGERIELGRLAQRRDTLRLAPEAGEIVAVDAMHVCPARVERECALEIAGRTGPVELHVRPEPATRRVAIGQARRQRDGLLRGRACAALSRGGSRGGILIVG